MKQLLTKKAAVKIRLAVVILTMAIVAPLSAFDRDAPVRSVATVTIHQGANANSPVVATLPKNSPLIVVKKYNGNGWLHVKPADKKKSSWKSGWIQYSKVEKR